MSGSKILLRDVMEDRDAKKLREKYGWDLDLDSEYLDDFLTRLNLSMEQEKESHEVKMKNLHILRLKLENTVSNKFSFEKREEIKASILEKRGFLDF